MSRLYGAATLDGAASGCTVLFFCGFRFLAADRMIGARSREHNMDKDLIAKLALYGDSFTGGDIPPMFTRHTSHSELDAPF